MIFETTLGRAHLITMRTSTFFRWTPSFSSFSLFGRRRLASFFFFFGGGRSRGESFDHGSLFRWSSAAFWPFYFFLLDILGKRIFIVTHTSLFTRTTPCRRRYFIVGRHGGRAAMKNAAASRRAVRFSLPVSLLSACHAIFKIQTEYIKYHKCLKYTILKVNDGFFLSKRQCNCIGVTFLTGKVSTSKRVVLGATQT